MIALAQYNGERNPYLGDVPTAKESGVDMEMNNPYIIAFPKGTDPAIVAKMSEIAEKVVGTPEYAEKLKVGFSQQAKILTTEEAKAYLQKIEDEYIFPILLRMYIRILKAGVKRYMCPIQPMINMCQGNFTSGKKP